MTTFYVPAAVYMAEDHAEWNVRKLARGFAIIGPYTCDALAVFDTLREAMSYIEQRGGPGVWEYVQRSKFSEPRSEQK